MRAECPSLSTYLENLGPSRMLLSSSSPRRPKPGGGRRSRVITSCHACRTDRTKCDRIHPVCGRCARRGGTCHWAGSALKSASATQISHHQQPHQRDFGVAHSQPLDEVLNSREDATLDLDYDRPVDSVLRYSQDTRPGYLALQGGGRSRYVHNNFWANVGHKVGLIPGSYSSRP